MIKSLANTDIEKEKVQSEVDKVESKEFVAFSKTMLILDIERSRESSKESDQKIIINKEIAAEWKLSDFHLEHRLGHGQYGKVYLARERSTKYAYAMKKQTRDISTDIMIWREIQNQTDLCHRNILRFYGFFYDDKQIFIILEHAPNGSLRKRLNKQPEKRFDEKFAARCILSCADALSYLHERDIIHRDIKPDNLLLGYNDELKLADFGLSIVNGLNERRRTICGTPDYIPPESTYKISCPLTL